MCSRDGIEVESGDRETIGREQEPRLVVTSPSILRPGPPKETAHGLAPLVAPDTPESRDEKSGEGWTGRLGLMHTRYCLSNKANRGLGNSTGHCTPCPVTTMLRVNCAVAQPCPTL